MMRAAILRNPGPKNEKSLTIEDRAVPEPGPGQVMLRVEACGVCRTDLHITMGELKPLLAAVTPGHQIVGRVEKLGDDVSGVKAGERLGVSWLGGVDGICLLCRKGVEKLFDG